MNLILLTDADSPSGSPGDALLVQALGERGVSTEWRNWRDGAHFPVETPILIRTPENYFFHRTEFLDWMRAREAAGTRIANPFDLIAWNSDKRYLRELGDAGIPIVPTRFIEAAADLPLETPFPESQAVVFKPSVSASAHGTFVTGFREWRETVLLDLPGKTKMDRRPSLTGEEMVGEILVSGSALLIQPFLPSITTDGEVSLLFWNSVKTGPEFSHAVLKRPAEGDYRVQVSFGGSALLAQPTEELLALGRRVLAAVPHDWLYARVDLVDWRTEEPKLGELELFEPDLYFLGYSRAAARFAELVVERLFPTA